MTFMSVRVELEVTTDLTTLTEKQVADALARVAADALGEQQHVVQQVIHAATVIRRR
jgi:hypothetical protein